MCRNHKPSSGYSSTYSRSDNTTWRRWYDATRPVQDQKAYEGYKAVRETMLAGYTSRVPRPQDLSERLQGIANFSLLPATGLTQYGDFFSCLQRRRFTAMTVVRDLKDCDHCENPDWIHESVGHVVSLADKRVSDLYQLFGEVAQVGQGKNVLRRLGRLFWFACEMGLVRESSGVKAFGAALLSSRSELENIESADLREFDPVEMESLTFNYRDVQPTYFVADSIDEMFANLTIHLNGMKGGGA